MRESLFILTDAQEPDEPGRLPCPLLLLRISSE